MRIEHEGAGVVVDAELGVAVALDAELAVVEAGVVQAAEGDAVSPRVLAAARLFLEVMDVHVAAPVAAGQPTAAAVARQHGIAH
jgi:hypothetical protein